MLDVLSFPVRVGVGVGVGAGGHYPHTFRVFDNRLFCWHINVCGLIYAMDITTDR